MAPLPLDLPHLTTSSAGEILLNDGKTTIITQLLPQNPQDNTSAVPTPMSSEPKMSFRDRREREVEAYKAVFNENMHNKPVKHKKVHVFMWSWKEELDDLNLKEEMNALQEVFEETYGFDVHRKELSTAKKANFELISFLAEFMAAYDELNTLLIFYYAGHGQYRNQVFELSGSRNAQAAEDSKRERNKVAWQPCEQVIETKISDVLVIFDCCEAGGFGGYDTSREIEREPPFQCLAACKIRQRTFEPGPQSFTSALIWALKELRHHHPFTSNNLLTQIKKYLKKHLPEDHVQTPVLLKRDQYNEGLVWLGPLNATKEEVKKHPAELRNNPEHEFLDIRLNFYRRVEIDDAKRVAKCLSKLIHEKGQAFPVRHVALLDKSSVHSNAIVGFTSGLEKKQKLSTSRSTLGLSPTAIRSRRTSVTYADKIETSPDELSDSASPLTKRAKITEPSNDVLPLQRLLTPPQLSGAWYHFRMALHFTVENVKFGIGKVSESIRPGQIRNGPPV